MSRRIDKIILHCSASDLASQDAAMIESWHLKRGFKKIGYHFFIGNAGKLETGRDIEEVGAHCFGQNAYSIGICMAGLTKFSAQQFDRLEELLKQLQRSYPKATVHGHREFANKTCPVYDYKKFKADYEAGYPQPKAAIQGDDRWKTSSNSWWKTCLEFVRRFLP